MSQEQKQTSHVGSVVAYPDHVRLVVGRFPPATPVDDLVSRVRYADIAKIRHFLPDTVSVAEAYTARTLCVLRGASVPQERRSRFRFRGVATQLGLRSPHLTDALALVQFIDPTLVRACDVERIFFMSTPAFSLKTNTESLFVLTPLAEGWGVVPISSADDYVALGEKDDKTGFAFMDPRGGVVLPESGHMSSPFFTVVATRAA